MRISQSLRALRDRGHRAFDQMWKSGLMSRTAAYRLLSVEMGVPLQMCHFSMFDESQCRRAIELFIRVDTKLLKKEKRRGRRARVNRKLQIDNLRQEELGEAAA